MSSSTRSMKIDNSYAKTLKALHIPRDPVIFTNIYDPASTTAILELNRPSPSSSSTSKPLVHAIASASYAIAASHGIRDEDLTLEQNLAAIKLISPLVRAAGLPFSVDLQDGYGEKLEVAVREAVRAGAVGVNIEDSYPERGFVVGAEGAEGALRGVESMCERIKRVREVACQEGLEDFVVNARTDVFRLEMTKEAQQGGWDDQWVLEEAVRRGGRYLQAGATCVFVWGGSARGVRRGEVEVLVKELGGMVAVKLSDRVDGLSVRDLAEIGVCRVSVGPSLWTEAMKAVKKGAERVLRGGQLWSGD